jgi:hypothetical protein
MTRPEVTAQKLELLVGRPRLARGNLDIAEPLQQLSLRRVGHELVGHHADRDARYAPGTRWPIRDALAAAKADPPERIVQLVRMWTGQFGEHLALLTIRQIRARRRAGDEKARETERRSHRAKSPSGRRD